MPTQTSAGCFTYDPQEDARAVLARMREVTPPLFAGNALLKAHMRVVLHCVRRRCAGLEAADEVLRVCVCVCVCMCVCVCARARARV